MSEKAGAGSWIALAALAALAHGPDAMAVVPGPMPAATPTPSMPETAESREQNAPIDLPDLTLEKADGPTLTLDQSIALAIRAATSVLKARNVAEVSGATLLQSYGQFLPDVTSQGSYGYNNGTQYYTTGTPSTVTGANTAAGFAVSADLNLFNGISDFSHLKSSLLRRDSADLSLLRAKQAIALDVAQSFLSVVLDIRLVEIAKKNLQESQAREQLLLEQTRVGAKNLSDLFRQQAQTSADQSLLLTSGNKVRSDQILLLQKLRLDVSKGYHFVDPELPAEKADVRFDDEASLLKVALATRADLQASDNDAQAAHWDVKVDWGNYLPKLDLVAGMASGAHYLESQTVSGVNVVPTTQTPLFSQFGSQIEYSIGLNLTWTLFDRFVTHQAVTQARAAADNADLDSEDRRNQVQADVRVAYGGYKTAILQLRASKKGLTAAEKAYEVIEGRYDVGSASFIDLVTAQAVLLQAESARAQALIDFTLQGKEVEFATGSTTLPADSGP